MNIAVTGIGILSAIGNGVDANLHALKAGSGGIAAMRYLQSNHKDLPVGEVKLSNQEMKIMLGIPATQTVSRTALIGAVAMREAVGQTAAVASASRLAVVSGTTVGGMDVTEGIIDKMEQDPSLLPLIRKHDCGACTREMTDILGIRADVCTISTACSSALNAIIVGCEMLQRGEADVVIAGGSEALSRFHLGGFRSLMILDSHVCRPFDATRAGLNLGEGAAYLVMQRAADLSATATPLAYITGYGNRCDAYHQTASSSDGTGAWLAMTDALQMAHLQPSDIQYVNAHGTGTPNNDASESAALRRLFSADLPPVSSTKSLTGHTTSASGAVETVFCILAMRHSFIPQNHGWSHADPLCITPCMATADAPAGLHHVLCNSFGFGGNDSALLLSSCPDGTPLSTPRYSATVAAEAEITNVSQLADYKEYISPKESRRMGKLLKAATLTSMQALSRGGIATPDAIITATAYGMLETSEKFLLSMAESGETTLSPTLFMQSTHNTIGSAIAIRTRCHGYNATYTQGAESLQWALRDARRLIEQGRAESVLVGLHDESTPRLRSMMRRLGAAEPPEIYSRSILMVRAN